MDTCCSAGQVAEAVLIWSAYISSTRVLCLEFEDATELKSLDLFLSTMEVFRDAFATEIDSSFQNHQEELFLSKQTFIEYLKPRALILTEQNGYFELVLMCAYVSRLVKYQAYSQTCFHFARTACKLLTRILEKRFKKTFATDFGWENLMSFCIKIHSAVFPSKENRPPGYEPPTTESNGDKFSNEIDKVEIENAQLDEESEENEVNNQKALESGNKGCTKYNVSLFGFIQIDKEPETCKENALDRGNNEKYWKYFTLEDRDICERITDNRKHLDNVYNLLRKLGKGLDSNRISSDIHDISLSDDEYAKQLERKLTTASFEISNEVKDCLAREICEKSNNGLTPDTCHNRLSPEDITKDEIMKYIEGWCVEESNGSYCVLCEGRIYGFIEKWKKCFCEKYQNTKSVTDII